LEKELHELNSAVVEEYCDLKKEFEELYDEKAKGAILRSRTKWIAQGERNTKYFYGLEKRNSTHQSIVQLQTEDNDLIESTKDILDEIHKFFSKLYSSSYKTNVDLMEEYGCFFENLPQISEADSDELGKEITIDECEVAMRQMADNKSPGDDGLPVEFYKQFWPELKEMLFTVYKHSLTCGEFYGSMTRGIIRLLPKPEKDLLHIKNWRPITLITVDYKILSKVLANRLKRYLSKIISEDQAGFIKGRYIGENIQSLLEIADEIAEKGEEGLMLSLDIEKAFDSIEFPFLFQAMAAFGIGEEFQSMIQTLYSNTSSSVMNNGYATHRFPLLRGVRQGDPLSPYLFILGMEILAIAIRNCDLIKGLELNGRVYKLLQYADDTTVFLKDDESLKSLLILLDMFEECSGLKTNKGKTSATGLGIWKKRKETLSGVKISPDEIKILGIWFCHDKKVMQDLNVGGKLEKIKKTLNSWFNRGLSLQGKIMVLKSLGLSQLTYPMTNLFVPKHYLEKIDKFVFQYIWGNSKKVKIRKTVLIQNYEDGGLKAPDIYTMDKTWKLGWIYRLQSDFSGKWKQILLDKLEAVGGLDYLLVSNFDVHKLPLKLSAFWTTVFEAYSESMQPKIQNKEDVKIQLINNNKFVMIDKKSIFLKILIDSSMDEVQNWFDSAGHTLTFQQIKARIPQLSWLRYVQIIAAIPQKWKRLLKGKSQSLFETETERPIFDLKHIKTQLRRNQIDSGPAAIQKWNMSNVLWSKMFTLARKITRESKLQVFQYKLLHRVIVTKKSLFRYKISNTENCPDCANEIETIEHMLFDCPKAAQLWQKVQQAFESVEKITLEPSIENFILGRCSKKNTNSKLELHCSVDPILHLSSTTEW